MHLVLNNNKKKTFSRCSISNLLSNNYCAFDFVFIQKKKTKPPTISKKMADMGHQAYFFFLFLMRLILLICIFCCHGQNEYSFFVNLVAANSQALKNLFDREKMREFTCYGLTCIKFVNNF